MQFTAVWLHSILEDWSLNDVCCYIPAWFGAIASAFVGLIAYEASIPSNANGSVLTFLHDWLVVGKKSIVATTDTNLWPARVCGVCAMAIMSIVPAHLMRSMGGGYDNESVAVSAMVATFYFWTRSLRGGLSCIFAFVAALCYFYMVASWGGYVFVLNLIGAHAGFLLVLGRLDTTVWISYSLFYTCGTALAVHVPVVGWAPLKSLEQLMPACVFLVYQVVFTADMLLRGRQMSRQEAFLFHVKFLVGAGLVAMIGTVALAPAGYFGPISSRVRGLFVQHTKTGNPLVDSVAEHQAASSRAYYQYLHLACTVAPVGFFYNIARGSQSDACLFLVVWGVAAYYFSLKMVRLVLLTAPIASIFGGIAVGRLLTWCFVQWWEDAALDDLTTSTSNGLGSNSKPKRKRSKGKSARASSAGSFEGFVVLGNAIRSGLRTRQGVVGMRTLSVVFLIVTYWMGYAFADYCWLISRDLANPSIIVRGRTSNGDIVTVDDYREAYWWLRDNTPEDSRVLAWWDYGYQISAIANRTTIADGNTWNHEHIALLGKALTTDLEEGYSITRHLADYVLIWGGGGGDDLAKSPHLARIANSVYRDHCPDDPTCRIFGFLDRQGTPSSMMSRSMLFHLHSHQKRPGISVPEDMFKEVYQSKYGKVRIFKVVGADEDSKAWVADEANLKCDVPGSWFCPGQYPPGLNTILSKKKDFKQLEDFNKRAEADDEYTEKYLNDLTNPDKAREKFLEKERMEALKRQQQLLEKDVGMSEEALKQKIKEVSSRWEDTEDTTRMWQIISSNNIAELKAWLQVEPYKAFIRSKDGRGPMFWAFEQRSEDITKMLMQVGVPHTDRDASGRTPAEILQGAG